MPPTARSVELDAVARALRRRFFAAVKRRGLEDIGLLARTLWLYIITVTGYIYR